MPAIHAWKKAAQDGMEALFEGDKKAARVEAAYKTKLTELHVSEEEPKLMRRVDAIFTTWPF